MNHEEEQWEAIEADIIGKAPKKITRKAWFIKNGWGKEYITFDREHAEKEAAYFGTVWDVNVAYEVGKRVMHTL